jgi:hypothetical protein
LLSRERPPDPTPPPLPARNEGDAGARDRAGEEQGTPSKKDAKRERKDRANGGERISTPSKKAAKRERERERQAERVADSPSERDRRGGRPTAEGGTGGQRNEARPAQGIKSPAVRREENERGRRYTGAVGLESREKRRDIDQGSRQAGSGERHQQKRSRDREDIRWKPDHRGKSRDRDGHRIKEPKKERRREKDIAFD